MFVKEKPFPYRRVVVIGSTGAGKSTLAERLSTQFGLKFIELDALHWEPGWRPAQLTDLRERVQESIQAEAWSVAGNYSAVRDLIWPNAEALIWLDYRFGRVFWQLSRRTFRRWWNQELLWGTNREPFWVHFKFWSDESLYRWLFKTHWRRKRETLQLLAQDAYRHLQLIRLTSPTETKEWLSQFQPK